MSTFTLPSLPSQGDYVETTQPPPTLTMLDPPDPNLRRPALVETLDFGEPYNKLYDEVQRVSVSTVLNPLPSNHPPFPQELQNTASKRMKNVERYRWVVAGMIAIAVAITGTFITMGIALLTYVKVRTTKTNTHTDTHAPYPVSTLILSCPPPAGRRTCEIMPSPIMVKPPLGLRGLAWQCYTSEWRRCWLPWWS